jgi:uncharacterized membrane protein (DUF4010 family)
VELPEPGYDSRLVGLAIALALGLLIGLQREWALDKPIGLRSFGLISLLGGLAALFLDTAGGWPLAAGLLALGIVLAAKTRSTEHSGVTTLVAALVTYLIGAAAVAGQWMHAGVLAGLVTLVLQWKKPMHGIVRRLGENDLETIARFVLITLVILPILPDRLFGPYGVFNPFETWLLVVLIVAINLAGYLAFRLIGARAGGWLAGIVGGLVSSTATTFSYARLTRQGGQLGPVATLVILIASTVVYARIALEVTFVAPALTREIIGPALAMGAVLLVASVTVFGLLSSRSKEELPEQNNPAQLTSALSFGAIYVAVLFAVAAARDWIGNDAVYAVAFVSGLTDVDALTLSVSSLYGNDMIDADTAWRTILLASLSNLSFKTALAVTVGSASLRRWILWTAVPALLTGVGILTLWP